MAEAVRAEVTTMAAEAVRAEDGMVEAAEVRVDTECAVPVVAQEKAAALQGQLVELVWIFLIQLAMVVHIILEVEVVVEDTQTGFPAIVTFQKDMVQME